MRSGRASAPTLSSRNWPADAAIVTEPTDLQIGVAHKGFGWVEVETRGVAAHGSRPADGRDAIFAHGTIAGGARRARWHAAGAAGRRSAGPGVASCIDGTWRARVEHVSRSLRAPARTSDHPGRARHQAARRGAPRSRRAAREGRPDSRVRRSLVFSRPPYHLDDRAEIVQTLGGVVRGARTSGADDRLSFWTDAAILGAAGIQTAIFGPGGAGLHIHRGVCRDGAGRRLPRHPRRAVAAVSVLECPAAAGLRDQYACPASAGLRDQYAVSGFSQTQDQYVVSGFSRTQGPARRTQDGVQIVATQGVATSGPKPRAFPWGPAEAGHYEARSRFQDTTSAARRARLEHEQHVGRPFAEAAHEVGEPFAAERHVDAHAVAFVRAARA